MLQDPSKSAMVIVEPRAHPHLQYVLENFDSNMPLGYDLYIFHGKSAGDFVRRQAKNVALHRHIVYIALEADSFSATDYNRLLKDEDFWAKIDAEKILTFQTDSVLCAASPRKINDFEHIAYIGCGYGKRAGNRTNYWPSVGDPPFWGNGGVTFRRKSKMLECLACVPHQRDDPEDAFYSICVDRGIGRHAESGTHLQEFCIQFSPYSDFVRTPFAAHKVQRKLRTEEEMEAFLKYCPEATYLVGS